MARRGMPGSEHLFMRQRLSRQPRGAIGNRGDGEHAAFNCRAAITSGTVDIPTASAPMFLKARISAGVSYVGPSNEA